jgi:hypothetical protein
MMGGSRNWIRCFLGWSPEFGRFIVFLGIRRRVRTKFIGNLSHSPETHQAFSAINEPNSEPQAVRAHCGDDDRVLDDLGARAMRDSRNFKESTPC